MMTKKLTALIMSAIMIISPSLPAGLVDVLAAEDTAAVEMQTSDADEASLSDIIEAASEHEEADFTSLKASSTENLKAEEPAAETEAPAEDPEEPAAETQVPAEDPEEPAAETESPAKEPEAAVSDLEEPSAESDESTEESADETEEAVPMAGQEIYSATPGVLEADYLTYEIYNQSVYCYTQYDTTVTMTASADADDSSSLTYQWLDGFENIIENATGSSYTSKNITQYEPYYCRITDENDNETTLTFYINVQNHLNVVCGGTEDEKNTTVYVIEGDTVTLTAEVTADNMEGMTYKWMDSNNNVLDESGLSFTTPAITERTSFSFEAMDKFNQGEIITFYIEFETDPHTNIDVDSALTIENGYSEDVTVSYRKPYAWYKFTPEENAVYIFRSVSNIDTYGYLYDADNTLLYENDDANGSRNFSVEYQLTAGNTYYFMAKTYSEMDSSFTVELYKKTLKLKDPYNTHINIPITEIGDGISLTVEAESEAPISYVWTYNGEETDCTTDTYLLVPKRTSENVVCTVSNGKESLTKEFYVYVENILYLDGTVNGKLIARSEHWKPISCSVEYNKPALLEVIPELYNASNISYSWYGPDDVLIENESGSSFTTDAITGPVTYRCEVVDEFGSVLDLEFQLSVDNSFSVEPVMTDIMGVIDESVLVYAGDQESVALEVKATVNNTDGLTYAWFQYIESENQWRYAADTAAYTAAVAKNAKYKCVVTDTYSNTDTIVFKLFPGFEVPQNIELSSAYAMKVDDTFNVLFSDIVPAVYYTFTPEKSGAYSFLSISNDYVDVRLANSDDEVISQPQTSYPEEGGIKTLATGYCEEGQAYYLKVESAYPDEECSLELSLKNEGTAVLTPYYNEIELKPADLEEELTLNVETVSEDDLTYSWEIDYVPVGCTEASYTFKPTQSCYVTCSISDASGTYSVNYHVFIDNEDARGKTIIVDDGISNPVDKDSYIVKEGSSVELKVEFEDSEFKWTALEWIDNDFENLYVDEPCLTVDNITKNSTYQCKVTDQYNNTEFYVFHLAVDNNLKVWPDGAPDESYVTIRTQPESEFTLKACVTADNTDGLTYTWSRTDGASEHQLACTANTRTEVLNSSVLTYRCAVKDRYDNEEYIYFYVVDEDLDNKITVNTSDSKVTVVPGDELVLRIDATATIPSLLSYNWYMNGVADQRDYVNADYNTLYIGSSEEYYKTGTYKCVVTDFLGSDTIEVSFDVTIDNKLTVTAGDTDSSEADITAAAGEAVTLKVNADGINTEGLTYKWTSTDPAAKAGSGNKYTVTVVPGAVYTCTVTDIYNNTAKATFTSTASAISLDKAEIALSKTSFTYNGKVQKPTVSFTYGGKEYTEGFTIAYSNVNSKNAGAYQVTVTGGGTMFKGKKTLSYNIKKKAQSPAVTVSAIDAGARKTFDVTESQGTLTVSSGNTKAAKVSVSGKKITVTGVAVGTARITIKAKGNTNYSAKTIYVDVKITPTKPSKLKAAAASNGKGIKLTWSKVKGATGYVIYRNNKKIKTVDDVSTYTDTGANTNGTRYTFKVYAKASTGTSSQYKSVTYYKVNKPAISRLTTAKGKKMTVKWAQNTKATGYQIQYSLKKNFSSATTVKVTKNSTLTKTISKLTKGKTYYIRLRTYKTVNTRNYYSAWSATKSVKIKK